MVAFLFIKKMLRVYNLLTNSEPFFTILFCLIMISNNHLKLIDIPLYGIILKDTVCCGQYCQAAENCSPATNMRLITPLLDYSNLPWILMFVSCFTTINVIIFFSLKLF